MSLFKNYYKREEKLISLLMFREIKIIWYRDILYLWICLLWFNFKINMLIIYININYNNYENLGYSKNVYLLYKFV